MNIYLISSFSERLLNDELNKITKSATNITKINYSDSNINEVIEECNYISLLDEEKIVIVRNFKISAESKKIESYLEHPNDKTKLILITDSIDKRSVIYKLINKNGHVIEISELKPNELNMKANNYAKSQNIKISYGALNLLFEYNLNNYDLVLNEIDKISNITKDITEREVEEYGAKLVSDESYALADAITNKNYAVISKLLNDFEASKNDCIPFVALLASSYRLIYFAKAMNKTPDEIARILAVHPYRMKLAKEKSIKYTKEELENILLELAELDYKFKSVNIPQYSLLKTFICNHI